MCTDDPSPAQELRSSVVETDCATSTINMTWEPPNDLWVDFYRYQLIDNWRHTIILDSNTTNTTAALSDVPNNINITFVITVYNCDRASTKVTFVIRGGK